MSGYRLVERAVAEVDDIALFTAERWGRDKAVSYVRNLYARFECLAANAMLGRTRDDLREGVRSWRQEAHMIFYRIAGDGIEIIGLPHASADFGTYFDQPD